MRPSWSTVGAVLTLTTYAVDAVNVTGHTCPRLPCSKCLTPEEVHGVGIGFDLSAAYGTAAIRYDNGSVVNVGKVHASQEYQALMKHLSENQRGALPSRFDPIWDEPDRIGEPSQKHLQAPDLDIGAISFLISELKAQTEQLLGHPIRSVAISSPDYIQLSEREISQAIEHLGLKNLADQHDLSLTSSEYAGYSSGVLTIPTTLNPCEKHEERMETILHLDYTQTTLSGSISNLHDTTLHHTKIVFADWYLGLSKKPGFVEEDLYWDLLWRRLRGQVQQVEGKITKVILTGDAVLLGDPRFFKVARYALRGFIEPSALRVLHNNPDPVFTAARGAAEFAKKTQEGGPGGCVESERCRALRGSF
ncbi:hypothetical protein EMCG_01452 [[Emmonsia] crescens]|uniref:Actin-like ATPase domain-containing protein n=1 Tax=[Emmonsia] crescens TaxID=73230 RepID=A0A0G2I0U9_9EURO|nr:hypothetical protein EMCG_01452 [Emmonsia crescens UAMH 3008]